MTFTPQRASLFSNEVHSLFNGAPRASASPMLSFRLALPLLVLASTASLPAGQSFVREADDSNVNAQYLIESVSFAGVDLAEDSKLPPGLRTRLLALIGQRCDVGALEEISADIRSQFHFRTVTEHLSRGNSPDRIKVNFEVVRRDLAFDVSLPKFLYDSQQGFTGELDASTQIKQNALTFGIVSNGDDMTERFSGVTARFDSAGLGSDKVRAGVTFEDYHEQWNPATVHAVEGTGLDLYRSRRNVAPQVTFAVARPLTVAVGASFEQTPGRSANAATLDVHYGHKIEGGVIQQQIEGKYSLRVATRALGSTYAYARHLISMRYEAKWGRHVVSNEFTGGSIAGDAPFFDRFVLGGSSTLRGWNRYQIDPLGGSRVVHDEMTYGHRMGQGTAEAFYDTGMLWNSGTGQPGRAAQLRHSVGVGYKQGIFMLTSAFPVHNGRLGAVFMAGMNY